MNYRRWSGGFWEDLRACNTQDSFRIRTGDVRAIFEIEQKKKIIYVWDIDYRGSIY